MALVHTSLYTHVQDVRTVGDNTGVRARGEESGEGWLVGGVRGQPVGSKEPLESPGQGGAADRKQEIIHEELHPRFAQIQPKLLHDVK